MRARVISGVFLLAGLVLVGVIGLAGKANASANPGGVNVPVAVPPYPYTYADSMYCQRLAAWNRAGIPGMAALRDVAYWALRAEGAYRATGTALITAVVAGGNFRAEAIPALETCRLRVR